MKTMAFRQPRPAPVADSGAAAARAPEHSIGSIMRAARELTDAQVEQILIYQRTHDVRFGDAAMALQLASRADVMWALSQQFHYPYAPSGNFNPELAAAVDPFGAQAELFRGWRSQLLTGVLSPDKPRVALAVISPDRGDGRTYFAANMAVAFSQLGDRTLLIDANLRAPRQHRLFGVEAAPGLSGILAGRAETDVIRQVKDLPSLYLLPAGAVPPNPTELLQRSAFTLLIQDLLSQFDHVIVDTPAGAPTADARLIAIKSGAAVTIARRNLSRVKPLRALLDSLVPTATIVAGVLINER